MQGYATFAPLIHDDSFMRYDNHLLLDVLNDISVDRPPVWVMRQAGRILPGYRKIRGSVPSFKHLVKRPDLIAEVTTEPLDELGVDAAILFSDILVIPEAMGVDYEIVEKVGPIFSNPIETPEDVKRLIFGQDAVARLSYVFDSIDRTKDRIEGKVPLIGFAGAPWTLMAYMIEGSGSKTFAKARRFMYEHPEATHQLLKAITETTTVYLKEKIRRGCDVVQLFDSWASMLSVKQYREFCIPYIQEIFSQLEGTPRIFFPKGAWSSIPYFKELPFEALSIDWITPVSYVRSHLGSQKVIQGNIDPALLYAHPDQVRLGVNDHLNSAGNRLIVNLGHGVYPDTKAENVRQLIQTVKEFHY